MYFDKDDFQLRLFSDELFISFSMLFISFSREHYFRLFHFDDVYYWYAWFRCDDFISILSLIFPDYFFVEILFVDICRIIWFSLFHCDFRPLFSSRKIPWLSFSDAEGAFQPLLIDADYFFFFRLIIFFQVISIFLRWHFFHFLSFHFDAAFIFRGKDIFSCSFISFSWVFISMYWLRRFSFFDADDYFLIISIDFVDKHFSSFIFISSSFTPSYRYFRRRLISIFRFSRGNIFWCFDFSWLSTFRCRCRQLFSISLRHFDAEGPFSFSFSMIFYAFDYFHCADDDLAAGAWLIDFIDFLDAFIYFDYFLDFHRGFRHWLIFDFWRLFSAIL